MKFSKENIETILVTKKNNRLCNDIIFSSFFKKLSSLNLTKIDLVNSSINIVNENHKQLELNSKEWDNKFPDIGFSYSIKLISKDNCSIPLSFNLWNSQVNIYMGEQFIHYADDVEIKTNKDLEKFNYQLYLLFDSKINEELHFKKDNIKKINYTFYNDKQIKKFKHKIGFNLSFIKPDRVLKNKFQPWTN